MPPLPVWPPLRPVRTRTHTRACRGSVTQTERRRRCRDPASPLVGCVGGQQNKAGGA